MYILMIFRLIEGQRMSDHANKLATFIVIYAIYTYNFYCCRLLLFINCSHINLMLLNPSAESHSSRRRFLF